MTPKSNAVTRTGGGAVDSPNLGIIRTLLTGEQFKKQLANAMPAHCSPDRQLRVILTALTKTPKLADCTQESLMVSLLDCSQLGLEPDGRRAHLIPYGTKCTLIIDYKGLVELIMRSGHVDFIDAYVVHRNEKFNIRYGSHPNIEHIPIHDGDPGEMIGAYCVAHVKNCKIPKFTYMRKDEIDAIRKRSMSGGNGPWVTDYNEMAKKTVIRRISKTLPQSAELTDALEKDLLHDGTDDIPASRLAAAKPALVTGVSTTAAAKTETTQQLPDSNTDEAAAMQEAERLAAEEAEANRIEEERKAAATAAEVKKKEAAAAAAQAKATTTKPATPAVTKPANPAPVTAPAAGTKAANPPPLPASSPEDVENLRIKCEEAGITELQVCKFAKDMYRIPAVETLAAFQNVSARRVTLILAQWDTMQVKIKEHIQLSE